MAAVAEDDKEARTEAPTAVSGKAGAGDDLDSDHRDRASARESRKATHCTRRNLKRTQLTDYDLDQHDATLRSLDETGARNCGQRRDVSQSAARKDL